MPEETLDLLQTDNKLCCFNGDMNWEKLGKARTNKQNHCMLMAGEDVVQTENAYCHVDLSSLEIHIFTKLCFR